MYEFSIAAKYLMPRWRQLSVSIISTISLLVIAAVVWLIVVFFSVSNGLTNSWIDKLIALTAPIRITPTQEYTTSYYHLVDSISANSDYSLKSINEKFLTEHSDPYDPYSDTEVPHFWPMADRLHNGSLKDPVKLAFLAINEIHGASAVDYEMTVASLQLHLSGKKRVSKKAIPSTDLSQTSYVGSLDPHNSKLLQALATFTPQDLNNLLKNLGHDGAEYMDGNLEPIQKASLSDLRSRLESFFNNATIQQLSPSPLGWQIPLNFLPRQAEWTVVATNGKDGSLSRIWLPNSPKSAPALLQKILSRGEQAHIAKLSLSPKGNFLNQSTSVAQRPISHLLPIMIDDSVIIDAEVDKSSISSATDVSKVAFKMQFLVQGKLLSGISSLGSLHIEKATTNKSPSEITPPLWTHAKPHLSLAEISLPTIDGIGDGILLPKSFREGGAHLGDIGALSYYGLTASTVQELQIPVYIAGFYDPGIIPIGGKYIIANREIASLIRSSQSRDEANTGNGINVRFDDYSRADSIKKELQEKFETAGISPYWKIETFREYEFTKDIIQQLQSEKRLFTLLATVIIIVACSNIISMLIILVNDKKVEIGILRSMGASSFSIAAVFGICGITMGTIGSIIGTIAAVATLKNIQYLVDFIGRVQGYEMFNPVFYGETLPTDLSLEALVFVIIATSLISFVAGVVPAVKASMLKPSAILKSE